MEDITLRALRVLREADVIACEDTRTSGVLFQRYGIIGRGRRVALVSLHQHNEAERTERLIGALGEGKRVALVSDAGTPGISDPGYLLLKRAIDLGFEVDVLPGPSALLPALLLSGLPPQPFVFYGFPPEKPGRRRSFFAQLASQPNTSVFYVSPHKAARQCGELAQLFPDRGAALIREISKLHQEAIRGTLSEVAAKLHGTEEELALRGEMVLVLAGAEEPSVGDDWRAEADALLAGGMSARDAAAEVSSAHGVSKNEVKEYIMGARGCIRCCSVANTHEPPRPLGLRLQQGG